MQAFNRFSLYIAGLALALGSCNFEDISPVVDIELPEHQSRPVIQFSLSAGDTLAAALISKSKGLLEPGDYELPSDARVSLLRDGQPLATLSLNPQEGLYQAALSPALPATPGARYRIEADVPGLGLAFAEAVMPAPPVVNSVEFREDAVLSIDNFRYDEFIVDIEDPAGVENYYAVSPVLYIGYEDTAGDTIYQSYGYIYTESNDPNLTEGYPLGFIFTDGAFDGRTYRTRLQADVPEFPEGDPVIPRLFIRVYQLTRESYLYLLSKNQYDLNFNNPFAEPSTVFNGITDGYGAFILSNSVEIPVSR